MEDNMKATSAKGFRPGKAAKSTLYEYAGVSTTHGISYVFDTALWCIERLLWLLVTLCFVTLAIYWSVMAYINWQDNPVLTTVKTTGLPINNINFPAITICSQGIIQTVIDGAMNKQFSDYVRNVKGKDIDTLTDAEKYTYTNEYTKDKFPGSATHPTQLMGVMTAKNPDQTLQSEILIGKSTGCINTNTTANGSCSPGWIKPTVTYSTQDVCYAYKGSGIFGDDPCLAAGATLIRFGAQDKINEDLYYILNENGTGADGEFWLDTYYHVDETYRFYGNTENLLDLNFMTNSPAHPPESGQCVKAKLDPSGFGRFTYTNTSCTDSMYFLCAKTTQQCNSTANERKRRATEASLDKVFLPSKRKEQKMLAYQARQAYTDNFRRMDLHNSYNSLFELLWYSQLPCFDVSGVTSQYQDQHSLIKTCTWKGVAVPCSKIFTTFPTDRGMCCTFNMDKAEDMFEKSRYRDMVAFMQERDKNMSFGAGEQLPDWWGKQNEPAAQAGQSKGLTLTMDAHSDLVSGSTVSEDFDGFFAIIDSSDQYPMTTRKSYLIRPGHNNIVSLSAIKVTADDSIESVDVDKRLCYFQHENKLKLHQNYSQANCVLECTLEYALDQMTSSDACIPWYFPITSLETRMCDPWEALQFTKNMRNIPDGTCDNCLPDCSSTIYQATVTAAPFRRCDYKNLGISELCTFELDKLVDPPIWGQQVVEQYEGESSTPPAYVTSLFSSNQRRYVPPTDKDSSIFTVSNQRSPTYDAYQKDIAMVSFFFESTTVFEYSRQQRMNTIDFVSQIGGLLGLCIGFSFISGVEIIYWFTIRLGKNMR